MQEFGKSFSQQNLTIFCVLAVFLLVSHGVTGVHGEANHQAGFNKNDNDGKDCDQRLMEEIFICVYSHNVSLTDFLLAVGGINDSNTKDVNQTRKSESNIGDKNDNNIRSKGLVNNLNPLENSNDTFNSKNTTNENGLSVGNNGSSNLLSSGNKTTVNKNTESERINSSGGNSSSNASKAAEVKALKAKTKERVCRHQQEVMDCTYKAAMSLIQNPECDASDTSQRASLTSGLLVDDQRYRIKSLVESLLGQYDSFCAHECRHNLLDDMRDCYGKFDLDAKLFMSRESHGAVIGLSAYDVEVFCRNRVPLVKCLKIKSDQCPESELVLSTIGLDLEMMEKGFDTLCQHQYTYLRSLECFESHTPEVGICHSIKHRRIIRIASLATLQKWSKERYLREACRIRLEHIRCDLDAWANKEDETCDENTLDLKRQLHCSLIPPPCLDTHRKHKDAICNSNHSSSGKSPTFQNSFVCSGLFLMILILLHFLLDVRLRS